MRSFCEETGTSREGKEIVTLLSMDEAATLVEAMEYYCKHNPRKKKARTLLNEMDKKFCIYTPEVTKRLVK